MIDTSRMPSRPHVGIVGATGLVGSMMRELLAANTNAPIAAFSGYSLAIRSPEVEEISREDRLAFEGILEDRYDRVESVPGFGQAGTTLEIWRLKKTEEAGASGEPAETAGE